MGDMGSPCLHPVWDVPTSSCKELKREVEFPYAHRKKFLRAGQKFSMPWRMDPRLIVLNAFLKSVLIMIDPSVPSEYAWKMAAAVSQADLYPQPNCVIPNCSWTVLIVRHLTHLERIL